MTLDIEQMKRDREAGTRGPWIKMRGGAFLIRQANGPYVASVYMWDVTAKAKADCRRIARVPDLEAQVLADAERIAELEAEAAQLRETAKDAMNCAIDAAGGSAEAWDRQAAAFHRLRVACGLILPSDRAALRHGEGEE